MKVLLLGGTDTISLPITRTLIERGDEVVVFKHGKRVAETTGFKPRPGF